jgi:hypothetical protein
MNKEEISEFAGELYKLWLEGGGCWCAFAERLLAEVEGLDEEEDVKIYRMLQAGEVLRAGDQYIAGNVWLDIPKKYLGNTIRKGDAGPYPEGYYRRPVTDAEEATKVCDERDTEIIHLHQRVRQLVEELDGTRTLTQYWCNQAADAQRRLERIKHILP